jgi:hypothetical protein
LQRAVTLNIDTKNLGLTIHELLLTDEILPQLSKFSAPYTSSQSSHKFEASGLKAQSLSQIISS